MMDHGFFIAMSYGAAAVAIVVELIVLRMQRARVLERIEAERNLEATD
ncbi:heme exporter protein CcmD [Usitatibacter palustris]|uniref:Heme exporter protein D n=1 Tax=Usitatibacter palustris TaxID=2732487 RepID=A0A6M4H5T5_9PROT|nr:heme exporter protein CcmD [Usitatibacter palustris]QJR15011.1 hypothetical protein DSM104440_01827 [Usitatibacter palustris]